MLDEQGAECEAYWQNQAYITKRRVCPLITFVNSGERVNFGFWHEYSPSNDFERTFCIFNCSCLGSWLLSCGFIWQVLTLCCLYSRLRKPHKIPHTLPITCLTGKIVATAQRKVWPLGPGTRRRQPNNGALTQCVPPPARWISTSCDHPFEDRWWDRTSWQFRAEQVFAFMRV